MEGESMVARIKLRFDMDQGARLWLIKYARKNLWRVQDDSYDFDDLVQDGFITWYKVAEKYGNDVSARKHQMSLFQVSFINYVNTLSTKRFREKPLSCEYDPAMNELLPDAELATFYTLCQTAPSEIKKVISFLDDDSNCQKLQGLMHLRENGTRETLGQRLRRLCDLSDEVDIVGMLQRHFGSFAEYD